MIITSRVLIIYFPDSHDSDTGRNESYSINVWEAMTFARSSNKVIEFSGLSTSRHMVQIAFSVDIADFLLAGARRAKERAWVCVNEGQYNAEFQS